MRDGVNILFLGGSNTVLKQGWVNAFLHSLSETQKIKIGKVSNKAVGANTCVHGLSITKDLGDLDLYDLIFVEYIINDVNLGPGDGYLTWCVAYESLLRYLCRNSRPGSRIVSVLFSRNSEPHRPLTLDMQGHVRRLSAHYGTEVVDTNAFLTSLLRPDDNPDLRLYVDGAHYRTPDIAALIGLHVAYSLLATTSQRPAAVPAPLHSAAFEKAEMINLPGFDATRDGIVTFSNSKYSLEALRIVPGKALELRLPGRIIMLEYITAAGAGSLLIDEAGERPFIIDTFHREVANGRFKFLIRSLVFLKDDWKDAPRSEERLVRFEVQEGDFSKDPRYLKKYSMIPQKAANPEVYLCRVMCLVGE